MTSLAIIALFCCITPALAVTIGGVLEVARSRELKREVTRAFAVEHNLGASRSR